MPRSDRRSILSGKAGFGITLLAGRASAEREWMSPNLQRNKLVIVDMVDAVWRKGELDKLSHYWTPDCVNHADPSPSNRGLQALRLYHEQFGQTFAAFYEPSIEIEQQIAEGDRVVTHMVTRAHHSASGKEVCLATIRIDRLVDSKIAEHWSVADMAGLMQQIAD